ncbi:hypothetical protein NH398_00630 [Halomonas sp. CnH100-B]|uniref:hypothetical protein n=1 Tax=Halomonas sp. CnH100-B TaxID=2954490 RepID=UPI0020978D9B|nr:hypothetical protein [Halomonas sp. CnH100-B]MCO7227740.1 hypothetical protein [Halomonas sp. CnH100-B]
MSELDKEYIENRVKDWGQRIEAVFSLVKNSLSGNSEIEFFEEKTVQMYEELMQEFNLSPVSLPVLEVKRKGVLVASFKPIGLWVIGANGRIDILTKEGSYILVDLEGKDKASNWRVYTPNNRKKSIPFDKEFVLGLV